MDAPQCTLPPITHHFVPEVALLRAVIRDAGLLPAELSRDSGALCLRLRLHHFHLFDLAAHRRDFDALGALDDAHALHQIVAAPVVRVFTLLTLLLLLRTLLDELHAASAEWGGISA